MGIGQGIAKCPYDPLDNSTAIYVEDGNPGGLPGLVSINYYFYYYYYSYSYYYCDSYRFNIDYIDN